MVSMVIVSRLKCIDFHILANAMVTKQRVGRQLNI